jgi:hypothetical protein
MQRAVFIISLALVGLFVSGCVGGAAQQISLYAPQKKSVILDGYNQNHVKNGAITLSDGSRILDEEGDIKEVFVINGHTFYLLNVISQKVYKVKDLNKNVLKEFDATQDIAWFVGNNKVLFAVRLVGNNISQLYDNVYEYDGKTFNLVNKNIDLRNALVSGTYYIKTYQSGGRPLNKLIQEFVIDIATGKQYEICTLQTNHKSIYCPNVIGVVGDKIYYMYSASTGFLSSEFVLEVFDTKTNQKHILLSTSEKHSIQFLRYRDAVVLKVFDKDLPYGERIDYIEFANEPAKYIDLATLDEVDGISSDFAPIEMWSTFTNVARQDITEYFITVSISQLYYSRHKSIWDTETLRLVF